MITDHTFYDLLDGPSYVESAILYEWESERRLSHSGTVILVGEGCKLYVEHLSLVLQSGKTHVPQQVACWKLYPGMHEIRRIVMLSDKGYVTIDAVNWCCKQHVEIYMLDRDGNVILTTCRNSSNVTLRKRQYDLERYRIPIAIHLIRQKTLSQIETLKALSAEYKTERVSKQYRRKREWNKPAVELLEAGLGELDRMEDIVMLLMLEARLALFYWDDFIGIPVNWRPKDEGIVPPHWKTTDCRISSLSGTTARHATNPFHAAVNYAYGVLEAQILTAINIAGLDPGCGYLHSDKHGRNSLVYDLMEPYRARIDLLVLSLFSKTTFNRGMLVPLDNGECRLAPQFARFVVASCMLPQDEINRGVNDLMSFYGPGLDQI
jgi:CRISPR-associated protein Cas1